MHLRHAANLRVPIIALLVTACGWPLPAPSSQVDGGWDAAVVRDAGRDAAAPPDANVDAFVVPDVGMDAPISCDPRTIVIATPGFAYTVDGVAGNPPIRLCAGVTYTFDLTLVATNHPMGILAGTTAMTALPGGAITPFTVPATAPFPDTYHCNVHGFGGAVIVQ